MQIHIVHCAELMDSALAKDLENSLFAHGSEDRARIKIQTIRSKDLIISGVKPLLKQTMRRAISGMSGNILIIIRLSLFFVNHGSPAFHDLEQRIEVAMKSFQRSSNIASARKIRKIKLVTGA